MSEPSPVRVRVLVVDDETNIGRMITLILEGEGFTVAVSPSAEDALSKLVRGRTTFIIAHRFSTLKIAERILLFENGQITASGSSEELLVNSERYRSLFELQAGLVRE